MIKIFPEKPRFPEINHLDIHAPAQFGEGLVVTGLKVPKRPDAPKLIRQADMRPHTMKVLGKGNPDNIIMSKDPGVSSTDSIMPHFGLFRNQRGFLSGSDPQVRVNAKLMPRPDSAIPGRFTRIPQPR